MKRRCLYTPHAADPAYSLQDFPGTMQGRPVCTARTRGHRYGPRSRRWPVIGGGDAALPGALREQASN
jgi:hypothetical protein